MSRVEASGENKGPGPPGTALEESVVYQCLCVHVRVLIYARDSRCGDRDPGVARETVSEPSCWGKSILYI